ncbi:MAG: hypothetical protein IPP77_10410 [Bacteroidetes bacterium]|nr:hypothetical protein [Bacteroidota bacterium]
MRNRKLKSNLNILAVVIAVAVLLYSCKPACERNPNDPECSGERELITTLRVIVSDSATGIVIDTFQFKDVDGNGLPEVLDTIRLNANTTYRVALEFLNESVSPMEDITKQILIEKNDHFIAYQSQNVAIGFTYLDYDNNIPPLPLGLQTNWNTGIPSIGFVHISLRHQPGVKNGTEVPGDTDVSVDFVTEIL